MGEATRRPGRCRLTFHRSGSIEKAQERIHWGDGTFSDVVVLKFPAAGLSFLDIDHQDPVVKLKDIAHVRYSKALERGQSHPCIVAFLRLERDRPVRAVFPDLACYTEMGEELLSANSLLTYVLRTLLKRDWLHRERQSWKVATPPAEEIWARRGKAVLALLEREGRLHVELGPGRCLPEQMAFENFPVAEDFIPIGRQGFLGDFVRRERPRIAFNSAFFLLEHHDFLSFHSALGEPYGLFVQDGTICRPPLYWRGTLCCRTNGQWEVERFSLEDVSIALPDGTLVVPQAAHIGSGFPFALNVPAEVTAYTRAYGIASHGRVLGRTPTAAGRVELTIVDDRVTSWKDGGNLTIPQNGFVLSFAPRLLSAAAWRVLKEALYAHPRVVYRFAHETQQDIVQALQVGPLLLRAGQPTLSPGRLAEEEFWIDRQGDDGAIEIGVVPSDYPDDVDRTRAGRVGLGVDRAGGLVLVGVTGANKATRQAGVDSFGATLVELADLLAEAGAVESVNLDGGGSTQVFFMGGLATVPGDRRGLPGVHYERMVPSAGVLY